MAITRQSQCRAINVPEVVGRLAVASRPAGLVGLDGDGLWRALASFRPELGGRAGRKLTLEVGTPTLGSGSGETEISP